MKKRKQKKKKKDVRTLQAVLEGWPTLLPPLALQEVSRVMHEGCLKWGRDTWLELPIICDGKYPGELDHAIQHYLEFMASDCEDTAALAHMATRSLMALEQHLRAKKQRRR